MLAPFNIEVISAIELNIEEPEETGVTFAENAELKAVYYGEISNLPTLADDSGLCIDALDGYPGVYSARLAPDRDFSKAIEIIQNKLLLKDLDSSPASFVCSLALRWPDGHVKIFEGKIDGVINFPPRGDNGFGYDPIFTPQGKTQVFAEMDPVEKNKMSHRAKAFTKLMQACF